MKNSLSRPEKLSASVLLFSLNSNCQTRNCPPRKTVRSKLSQNSQSPENLSFAGLVWLPITYGTIYSWGLRVAFLSSRTAAVAGCADVCPHGNPNCYIVFVIGRFSFRCRVHCCFHFLNFLVNMITVIIGA